MASYANEVNWWKKRASEFESKRAALQPLSYSYASQAYSARGNYNGAASLDSMRLSIYREADIEDRKNLQEIQSAIYTKPLTKAEQARKERDALKAKPANAIVQPSESVKDLDSSVQRLQDKIKGVGGDVGRTLIGGFTRIMDVISRTTYAAQNIRVEAIKDAKASGGNISAMEHLQIAVKPFTALATPVALAGGLGYKPAQEMYQDAWQGLSGKAKSTGIEALRAEYPNWAKEHNVLANVAGFASDIVSDPLTYLTMGTGSTVARTGGALGAKAIGKKAYSQALLDQTIWTKTGRETGKQTLKDNVRVSKFAKEAKATSKAAKASTKADRAATKTSKKVAKGKATQEAFDAKVIEAGRAQAHYEMAKINLTTAQKEAFEGQLRGLADVGRYIAKHPFKATGSFGQGMRTGSIAAGNKAAKAAHAEAVAGIAADMKSAKNPINAPLRRIWETHKGSNKSTINYRGITVKMTDDFNKFVDDIAAATNPYVDVTQSGRRALRARSGVLAQTKAERYGFISKLVELLDGTLEDALPYADNLVGMGYPAEAGSAAATAARGRPKVAQGVPDLQTVEGYDPIWDQIRAEREGLASDAYLTSAAEGLGETSATYAELIAARPPEMVATDAMNGLSELQIGARERYKAIAKRIMDERGIPNEGGVVTPAAGGELGVPNYTTSENMAIGRALRDATREAIDQAALESIMNDPVVIVRGYENAANDILNRVSADTHVQVMQLLHYEYGMSMPSMNLPKNQVDQLFVSGDIYKGAAKNPDHVHKGFTTYLTKRVDDAVGVLPSALDDAQYARVKAYIGDDTEALSNVMGELNRYEQELNRLHYAQETPAVDMYTMLDHIVFGRGPTEELTIGTSGIGRAAHLAPDFNTNNIPAFNPEVLDLLLRLDDIETKILNKARRSPTRAQDVPLIKQEFKNIRHGFVREDLRRVADAEGVVSPRKMLYSLGAQLDLLHNTTETQNFSIAWRRQIASNLWGMPAKKVDGTFEPGVWSSANLMTELNDAIGLGILYQSVVRRKNPAEVAEWMAKIARENPELEKLLRQADLEGTRAGKTGAGFSSPNPLADGVAARTPNDAAAQAAKTATEQQVPEADLLQMVDKVEAENYPGASNVIDPNSAELSNPSTIPGGYAAPDITPQTREFIEKFLDEFYDGIDTVTLQDVMNKMQSDMIASINMYDQKMAEQLGQFQLATSMQVRVMGVPVGSLPLMNNPMHTNAGVHALIQDLPKHLHARSQLDSDGVGIIATTDKWFKRPTSKLDETMRQIMTKFSGESNYTQRRTMDEVRSTYYQFKSRAELKASIRNFFNRGELDPRLAGAEERFNDIHNMTMEHAVMFTQKDIGYDHPFVRRNVEGFMAALGGDFKIKKGDMSKFNSENPPYSREWFADLGDFLADQPGALRNHPLSSRRSTIDMPALEFQMQQVATKMRVKNNTQRTMMETFGMRMRPDVVDTFNSHANINNTQNRIVPISEAFGKGNVPEDLKGMYVNQSVAGEMARVMEFIDSSMDFSRQRMNYKFFREINNTWKSAVTIFSGRYHVGNAASDGYMNLLDGVRGDAYKKAGTVIWRDPETVALYENPDYIKAMNEVFSDAGDMPEPGDVKFMQSTQEYMLSHGHDKALSNIVVGGKLHEITGAEYQMRFRGYGLDQNQVTGNLQRGSEMMATPGVKQFGQASVLVQDLSAKREDYFRMAHFIHAVEQEAKVPGRSLDEVFLAARDRVMYWHFDYDNVTEFERQILAPLAPFYKWTRNIVPLSFSVFFTNPKAYTIGNSANRAFGQMMFPTQEDSNGEPIPLDIVVPRWITEQGAQAMEQYTDEEGNQQWRYAVLNLPFDQAMVRWLSPFTDTMVDPEANNVDKYIRRPGESLASNAVGMTIPPIQALITAATGKAAFGGDSIPQSDWWDPLARMLTSSFGVLGEIKQTADHINDPNNPYSLPQALDDVGAIRGTNVSEGAKKGELLRQEDRLEAIYKVKSAAWLKKNYPTVDPNSETGKKILHDHNVDLGILLQ
jgi:hypothetical protein